MGLMIGFMGGTLLDDRCVHFENTRKPLWMVARLLGGLAVYLALNSLLKKPFSAEFDLGPEDAYTEEAVQDYTLDRMVVLGGYYRLDEVLGCLQNAIDAFDALVEAHGGEDAEMDAAA